MIKGCQNTIIPNTVKAIGDGAFQGSVITSITIPDSVTSIGSGVFAGCSGLTTVNYIGTQEQWNAITGLASASIPSNVTINYNYTGE